MSGHATATLFDHMVWTIHRQIYAGPPHVPDDLPATIAEQRKLQPAVVEIVVPDDARPLDLHAALPSPSEQDLKRYGEVMESVVRQDKDGRVRVDNHSLLKPDTWVEIQGHGVVTVEEFKTSDAFDFSGDESDSGKYRCQCIYRASDSWNGIMRKFRDGRVMHHDNGSGITYWMDDVQAEFEDLTEGEDTAARSPETLDDFLDRYVYITESDKVFDLAAPNASLASLPRTHFLHAHAGVTAAVRNGNTIRQTPLATLWMKSFRRATVRGVRYAPDRPRGVFDEYEASWVNSFAMPQWDASWEPDAAVVAIFLRHISKVVDGEREQNLVGDWFAHLLQYPGERQRFALLMLAKKHGTGRGWLLELMRHLLGPWNVKSFMMKEFDSDFDDTFVECLLNAVEEVHDSSKERYAFGDNLKDRITTTAMVANIKYGAKRLEKVYSSMLMMSNHPDAIVLNDADRRVLVVETEAAPEPDTYFDELYGYLKEPEFLRSVAAFLLRRDLSEYRRILRAPKTAAKAAMADLSKSPADVLVETFLEECPAAFFTAAQVVRYGEYLARNDALASPPDARAVAVVLGQKAQRPKGLPPSGSIKVDGTPLRPWQRQGHITPSDVSPVDLCRRGIHKTQEWLKEVFKIVPGSVDW